MSNRYSFTILLRPLKIENIVPVRPLKIENIIPVRPLIHTLPITGVSPFWLTFVSFYCEGVTTRISLTLNVIVDFII